MEFKEYKYYATAEKTAKENGLFLLDKERIFDFSCLVSKNLIDIPEREAEVIINEAKHIYNSNTTSFYGKKFDEFSACDGTAKYIKHKVYSKKTGKFKYTIFMLAKLNHYSKSCKHVYDQYYDIVASEFRSKYTEPMADIEI